MRRAMETHFSQGCRAPRKLPLHAPARLALSTQQPRVRDVPRQALQEVELLSRGSGRLFLTAMTVGGPGAAAERCQFTAELQPEV